MAECKTSYGFGDPSTPVGDSGFRAWRARCVCVVVITTLTLLGGGLHAADPVQHAATVLDAQQRREVQAAVQRGLDWLAAQQRGDGSFETIPFGQPGVTSLCLLAFACHGHLPGQGPYGDALQRAVSYVTACQKQSGLVSLTGPEGPRLNRTVGHQVGCCAAYNHAISSLALTEVYGTLSADQNQRLGEAIQRALGVTLEMQTWPKDRAMDRGGWRYLNDFDSDDSDVSITGWHLMFLRSAKNAGFDVPHQAIQSAVGYVRRSYRPESSTFAYANSSPYRTYYSRGVTGAGALALAHASEHNTPEAEGAGQWLLQNGFGEYNHRPQRLERYHYGLLTCTQAMYQLGGQYWAGYFPPTVRAVLANQQPDGSWPRESHHRDSAYGAAYTSAICLITLGAPNDLLPIFQR